MSDVPDPTGHTAATPVPPPPYAGWMRRVSAAFFDALLAIPFAIPGFVVLALGPTEATSCTDVDGAASVCDVPTDATIAAGTALVAAGLLVYLVIHVRLLGRGATWGRGALGYRVLDARTSEPIGTGRAAGRMVASIVSAVPCYLGFLWPLWDAENRTFHDMIVRTRAVRTPSPTRR